MDNHKQDNHKGTWNDQERWVDILVQKDMSFYVSASALSLSQPCNDTHQIWQVLQIISGQLRHNNQLNAHAIRFRFSLWQSHIQFSSQSSATWLIHVGGLGLNLIPNPVQLRLSIYSAWSPWITIADQDYAVFPGPWVKNVPININHDKDSNWQSLPCRLALILFSVY